MIDLILLIVVLLQIVGMVFGCCAIIRSEMIFRYKENYEKKCLNEDYMKYKRLPSQKEMLYKFWIWDFDRFLKDE